MLIEQYTTLMGFECVLDFEVVVDSYGEPDGWYQYTRGEPEWYVDECYLYVDPVEKIGGGYMEVTGEMLAVLTTKFASDISEKIVEKAAEEYWTEKWTEY